MTLKSTLTLTLPFLEGFTFQPKKKKRIPANFNEEHLHQKYPCEMKKCIKSQISPTKFYQGSTAPHPQDKTVKQLISPVDSLCHFETSLISTCMWLFQENSDNSRQNWGRSNKFYFHVQMMIRLAKTDITIYSLILGVFE